MAIEIIVGLPSLSNGPLLQQAVKERYPVLISANSLSNWSRDGQWKGWKLRPLAHARNLVTIDLDSAGFVAHRRYGGFPWTIDQYFDLARAFPFRRFASLDYCVEQEIAHDRATVLERISRTVAANHECRQRAAAFGILDRFMPVLQGRTPQDYERCADSLHAALVPGTVVGVGSMCRRNLHGPEGLLGVVEHLDRILPAGIRLHLFGVKGQALSYLSQLDRRVASIDSQAYGIAARQHALKHNIRKPNTLVAAHMVAWCQNQQRRLRECSNYQIPLTLSLSEKVPQDVWQAALLRARSEILDLIEGGELDHDDNIERWIFDVAADLLSQSQT